MNDIIKMFLKLPYKSIDTDVINYVIEDILNNDNKDYTDDEIINIIKAFCYKKVSRLYTDFDIKVVEQQEIDKITKLSNVEGLVFDKTIYLEKSVTLDIINKNIEILRIIMHEAHHVKQRHMIEFNDISYKAYLLILEQIVIEEMNDKYYEDNYKYFFEEIDARLESEFGLYDYLSIHSEDTLSKEFDDICYNISECEKEAENILRTVNDKSYEREELFDRIIGRNPSYIEKYPLLCFYYNPDGSKVTIGDIIARCNCEAKNSNDKKIIDKVKKLDYYIIKNRRGSRINLQNDIKSLLVYKTLLTEEEFNELVDYLNKCYESNNSSYVMDIYDGLIKKINSFKNTVSATNRVATKIYIMMQNMGN